MKNSLVAVTYEIDLEPGETLVLPPELIASLKAGRWRLTLQPLQDTNAPAIRDHSAFLNSYAPEDEGLYDDDPPR